MEKQNDVKQEHYVPRSYLAWFADCNGKIHVYDYGKMEYRKNQSIDKLAKIGKFYDFDEENLEYMKMFKECIDKQYIENMFSQKIEPALKYIIEGLSNPDKNILNSCSRVRNHELKLSISYLLVFQFLRTRSYRDFFEKIFRDDKKAAFEHKKILLDQMTIDNLANYICNMSWTLSYNFSERPYITSDNPVVILDNDFNYGNSALITDERKTILYPLSSQILLLILDEGYTKEHNSDIIDIMICGENDLELIDFPNSQQMENAYQFVFSSGAFDKTYFEDKSAGYIPPTMSPYIEEYGKSLDELIEQLPKLNELLEEIENPKYTMQDIKDILKEWENIWAKVNEDRIKMGLPKFKIPELE